MPLIPTEFQEQCGVIKWARLMSTAYPGIGLLYSIPNASKSHVRHRANLAKSGLLRGIPDLCLPIPRGNYHSLYIELKRQKGGRASKEQKAIILLLQSYGHKAVICAGADEAIKCIENYLGITKGVS